MKHNSSKQFLLALLAAAGSLFACNQVEPEDNPGYNPETKEVATSFVLSVSTSGEAQTKMSAETVQKSSNFYGIDSCKILLFHTPIDLATASNPDSYNYIPFTKWDSQANATQTSEFLKMFTLGMVYAAGDIDPTANSSTSSNRILKLNIPLTASTALFYGKAAGNKYVVDNKETGSRDRGKSWGYIPEDGNLGNIEFNAQRRISNASEYDATGRLMAYVINQILASKSSAIATYDVIIDNAVYATYTDVPAISWKALGDAYNDVTLRKGLTPLEEVLGAAYSSFTTIRTFTNDNNQVIDEEFRSGSSKAIREMMKSMYTVVESVLGAKPTNKGEANAFRLAAEIETTMNRFFDSSWNYKTASQLREKDSNNQSIIPDDVWENATTGFVGAKDINDYPGVFNIPDGAAQLQYDSTTGKMSYLDPNRPLLNHFNADGSENLDAIFYPLQYYYPVELVYYANSALRTTDKANIQINDFQDGVEKWDGTWAAHWSFPRMVKSSNTGVAMATNVNYGSAMLATTVEYDVATLIDNKAMLTDDPDNNSIAIADAKLKLTGVLVGGFNPKVNWQFLRKDTTDQDPDTRFDSSAFNNVVYDNAIGTNSQGVMIPANVETPTAKNYTLVWDNYNSSVAANKQNAVYVALEFENGGAPFWGKHNLIGTGMKFYLLAKLSPDGSTTASQSFTWPAHYNIPPIYGGEATDPDINSIPTGKKLGDSKEIRRIFIQDFMTTAKFHIGAESLKKAYVSMPDMSQSEMSFGLSVDLSWNNGFEYVIDQYL